MRLAPRVLRSTAVAGLVAGLLVPALVGSPGATAAVPATALTATGVTATDVKVASYNISNLAFDSQAAGDHAVWKKRRPVIRKQILAQRLDVVGLQEANQSSIYPTSVSYGVNQYMDLLSALTLNGGHYALTNEYAYNCVKPASTYKCVYQDRGASQDTRIMYNTDTVSMESQGSLLFRAQSPGNPRYLAWAIFKLNSNGREFLFTNTHLTPSSSPVRQAQWDEAIDLTNSLKADRAVIAVGDYNTSKYADYAATYLPKMKAAGYGDVLNQQYATNPVKNPRAATVNNAWINSFNGFRRNIAQYSYSTQRTKTGNNIDWVFASNDLVVKNWSVVVPLDSTGLAIAGVIPSDHNEVVATLALG